MGQNMFYEALKYTGFFDSYFIQKWKTNSFKFFLKVGFQFVSKIITHL